MSQAPHSARALRAIALFEAFKGAVALAALLGVIDRETAERFDSGNQEMA